MERLTPTEIARINREFLEVTDNPTGLQKTAEAFRRFELQKIKLCHCTGVNAYAELAKAFPGRCSWPGAGSRVHFGGK